MNSSTALGGMLLLSSKKSHSCDGVPLKKCLMINFCYHVENISLVLVYVFYVF